MEIVCANLGWLGWHLVIKAIWCSYTECHNFVTKSVRLFISMPVKQDEISR